MPVLNQPTKYDKLIRTGEVPFPTRILTIPPWNEFLHDNGYEELSQKLNLQILSELETCRKVWRDFSPNQSVFDLWEVRQSFYDGYGFIPYFLTIRKRQLKNEIILGILPLWFNTDPSNDQEGRDNQKYVWFGSNWPEDNVFFVKNPEVIPLLLAAAPKPLELACIRPLASYQFLFEFPGFASEEDKKYFLDLSRVTTINDFLVKLKKKKRYNLRRDRKKILSLKPGIQTDQYMDLEKMFALSIERFRIKYPDNPDEYSAFEDDRRKNVFRSLVNHAKDYKVRLITTKINGHIEAVEFGLVYNKVYYAFNAGVDISKYSGLGVFSNLLVIEDALSLGCRKIDFLESDNNWKDSWHLDHYYQYQFIK